MSTIYRRSLTGTSACAAALICAGCAKELTREHFDLIEVNATADVVEELIGEPDQKRNRQWVYEDDALTVLIDFDDDGFVTRKQWHDEDEGEHYDSDRSSGGDDYQRSP